MTPSLARPTFAATLVFGFAAAAQTLAGVIATLDPVASGRFELLVALGFLSLTGTWWAQDRRRLGMWAGMDAGFFFAWAWPVLLPSHLIRTRRWRGVGIVVLFIAIYWGCFAVASLATYTWFGR
jgi:hypothetical protein